MSDTTNETAPVNTSEATEAPATTAEAPASEAITLDSLTQAELGDAFGQTHKGINRQQVMSSLDPDAKKMVAGFQADYTRKSQELAAARKALEEERSQMRSLLSAEVEQQLKAQMALPTDVDISKPEGLQAYINAKVAEQLNASLEPQRQQMRDQQRRTEMQAFINSKSDFDTYKGEVIEAMKGYNMKMEDAYTLVKGRHADALIAAREEELARYKSATKDAGLTISTGRNPVATSPKGQSAWERFLWREEQKKINGK